MSDFYTVKTLSEKLGIFEGTVRRWARGGELPRYKIGGKWRFNKIETDKWIKEREIDD